MIGPKNLIKMAKKCHNVATSGRKNMALPGITSSRLVDKGHFVVYTYDMIRFIVPLEYLKNSVFRELLTMAEEEYGLPRDGPIRLPCDAASMEYAITLIQRDAAEDLEDALLMSITADRFVKSTCCQTEQAAQQLLICSF